MQIRRILTVAAAAVAAFALVACSGDADPTPAPGGGDTPVTSTPAPGGGSPSATPNPDGSAPAPQVPDGRRLELAPIEGLSDVRIMESAPPQYAVTVTAGLPSGCAVYEGTEVTRDGNTITLVVWNSMPSDPNVACTMIYGIAEHNISLGSAFQSGETYTVIAGDRQVTFTAQ
ncbi:MAG: hypothetical protein AMXMBFR23_17050 [Chloroflexota bacterium]